MLVCHLTSTHNDQKPVTQTWLTSDLHTTTKTWLTSDLQRANRGVSAKWFLSTSVYSIALRTLILLFADDIALIADSEEHLQRMLDFFKSLVLTEQNECKHI